MEAENILSTFDIDELRLDDGSVYKGQAARTSNGIVPHGMGIAKYPDHNVLGKYVNGHQEGPAYINYHDWMWAGEAKYNQLQGWGLFVDHGQCQYGIFKDNVLRVDLTNLVKIIWNRILEMSHSYKFNMVRVLKDKREVFIGYPEVALYGKLGFHFTDDEFNDYIGVHEFGHPDEITGKFIQVDKFFNTITLGEFKEGKLVRTIDKDEFASAAELWVDHEFLDFDISDSFMFRYNELFGYHFYKIFEVGQIPGYTIVKAKVCVPYTDHFEVKNDVRWFKFDNGSNIIDELEKILNSKHPWVPAMRDYTVEFINNIREAGTSHLPVFKHVSCDGLPDDYTLDFYEHVDFAQVIFADVTPDDSDLPLPF